VPWREFKLPENAGLRKTFFKSTETSKIPLQSFGKRAQSSKKGFYRAIEKNLSQSQPSMHMNELRHSLLSIHPMNED